VEITIWMLLDIILCFLTFVDFHFFWTGTRKRCMLWRVLLGQAEQRMGKRSEEMQLTAHETKVN